MRKLVGSVLLTSAVLSTTALATNGVNLIGVSPASRAMGGIGVGANVGATDALFRNPAWMHSEKGFNVSFGGILFMPNVKAVGKVATPSGLQNVDETSDSDMFTIPEVAIVNQIDDKLTVGIGAFGVSGMGVDYRGKNPVLGNIYTNFQFMRIIPAVSYEAMPGLVVGGSLHLAWGALDLRGGASQDYGIGAQVGIGYDLGMMNVGATYISQIAMTYKNVADLNGDNKLDDMKLTQPQEFAFGVGVKPMDNLLVGLDIRWINWSDADGYKDFGWDDQWVFAIGGEYEIDNLTLRAGYNYGKSPLSDITFNFKDPTKPTQQETAGFRQAFFNVIGFPAVAEHHITLGAGYQFTKNFTLNVSYVYSPKSEVSLKSNNGTDISSEMTQHSIGIGLDWNF
jgi:long-chain fatty acid transport protein